MRLRRLRRSRGWTQVRLAEEFGIDRSYISDVERGKKNVCLPTMEVLAQGFGISLAQLVRGLDRERPPRVGNP
jgi:transcriptional regulator with XRE-family HTH domain